MGDGFEMSWATLVSKAHPDGLWASAYHIKVAVRDGETFWLSSGNWQSSNQPDVHPFDRAARPAARRLPAEIQPRLPRDHRERHARLGLRDLHQARLRADRGAGRARVVRPARPVRARRGRGGASSSPSRRSYSSRCGSTAASRCSRCSRPTTTPRTRSRLIQSAKKSVWFQNQYINFRDTGEDFPIFKRLIVALKNQIDKGLDVRIICRDMMKQESVDVLVALGFPRS